MKRIRWIGLLVMLALAACTSSVKGPEPEVAEHGRSVEGPSQKLVDIDSLMWRQPDSALTRLLPYFDTCCRDTRFCISTTTEFNRHYANLLLAELLYKNDYEQTNRVELQQAMTYFDSLVDTHGADTRGVSLRRHNRKDASHASTTTPQSIAFFDARAHYINGVGYYENGNVVQACKEYMKALEIMQDHFKEKEFVSHKAKFIALTYTHLTSLFSDQYLHEQAVYFGKMALTYYKKYDASPRHVAWILDEIGAQFEMLEVYDSAILYYRNGINSLFGTNNLTYRDLSASISFCSYKMGKSSLSILYQLYNMLNMAESDREYFSRCLTIGEIYYQETQYDSAWLYLKKVYEGSKSIDAKKQAAEWLVEIHKTQGQKFEIHEYAEFLVPFANLNENQGYLKSQLYEMYNGYQQRITENVHQKRIRDNRKNTNIVAGLLFITIIISTVLYFVNRKRQQTMVVLQEKTEKLLETERYAHKMQQAALAGRLKKSNETLKEERKRKQLITEKGTTGAFTDEPVCSQILKVVKEMNFKAKIDYKIYEKYALSKSQLMDLRNAVNLHFGSFTQELRKNYPSLTNDDINYCCLYLLGLEEADIAALVQKTYTTVCHRSRKLKKIFGTNDNLSSTLHNLARK